MSRQVRVSDETYARLQQLADGRALGLLIDRALDAYEHGPIPDTAAPADLALRRERPKADHEFEPRSPRSGVCTCGKPQKGH